MASAKKEKNGSATGKKETLSEENPASTIADGATGILGSASRIVFKAAGILEEEIARGIIAAREIEEKYTDVPKLRAGEGALENRHLEDLLVRFRKDAHDVIDLVIDFAALAANNVGKLSSQLINIRQDTGNKEDSKGSPAPPPEQVPLIRINKILAPGEKNEVPLLLENDNPKEKRTIEFTNTVFTDSAGNQLLASILSFNPEKLVIEPASKASVKIRLTIPENAVAGTYTSFLQDKNSERLNATIMITIATL